MTRPLRFLLFAAALAAGLPPASAQTVNPGAEALDASLLGARFRTLGSTGNGAQRIFAGLPDLGTATVNGTPNRVDAGGNWGPLATSSTLRFNLDRAQDQLVAEFSNATGPGGATATYRATYTDLANRLVAIKGTQYGLDDLNVLRVSLRREADAALTLTDLRINDQLLPGVTLSAPATGSAGSAEWSVVDICLGAGNGFSFSAVLTRTGTLSGSQEANKIDLVAGVSRARGLRCVNPADLALTAAAFTPATIAPGATSQLALTARNQGPGALGAGDGARIDLTLPAPLAYVSDDAGCDVSALPALRCPLGALDAGAQRELRIVVRTPANAGAGTVTVQATVASPITDTVAANNPRSASLAIIDSVAPTLAGLAAIGAPANGEFVAGAILDGAITRLLLRWSEPMLDGPAGDASRFLLLGSGADGEFATATCGAVLGDDQPLALAAAYLAAESSSVLVPAGADGLRPGRWRLLVCPGLTDRAGNPLAAVAAQDFEVAFDNPLVNPNFDASLDGYSFSAPVGSAGFGLLADDAQGTQASRALEISAAAGIGEYTFTQCMAAPLLAAFGTGARARVAGDASVAIEVELRRLPDCEGPLFGDFTLPLAVSSGGWTRTDGVSASPLPTGIFSARITVRASLRAVDARVAIDNLYFDRRGTLAEPDGLFSSSFED